MDKLVDFFTTTIGTDKVWVGTLCLCMYLLLYFIVNNKFLEIFAHFSNRKDKEIELAKILLEAKFLGKEVNSFLIEHLEAMAFFKYSGIKAGRDMRTALIVLQGRYNRTITWRHLRRAFDKLSLDSGSSKIKVKLEGYEKLFFWVVVVISVYGAVVSMLGVGAAFYLGASNPRPFFILLSFSIVSMVSTALFSSMSWPYLSARRIIKAIEGAI